MANETSSYSYSYRYEASYSFAVQQPQKMIMVPAPSRLWTALLLLLTLSVSVVLVKSVVINRAVFQDEVRAPPSRTLPDEGRKRNEGSDFDAKRMRSAEEVAAANHFAVLPEDKEQPGVLKEPFLLRTEAEMKDMLDKVVDKLLVTTNFNSNETMVSIYNDQLMELVRRVMNPENAPLSEVEATALDKAASEYVNRQGMAPPKRMLVSRKFLKSWSSIGWFRDKAPELYRVRQKEIQRQNRALELEREEIRAAQERLQQELAAQEELRLQEEQLSIQGAAFEEARLTEQLQQQQNLYNQQQLEQQQQQQQEGEGGSGDVPLDVFSDEGDLQQQQLRMLEQIRLSRETNAGGEGGDDNEGQQFQQELVEGGDIALEEVSTMTAEVEADGSVTTYDDLGI